MSQSRLVDYLDHMLEASRLACSYVNTLDKGSFLADKRTQQAVILNIIVIGEAATKISQDHPGFAAQHVEVPWKSMRGMRNRIAHGYFDINLETVWEPVQSALPVLTQQLTKLREGLSSADGA